MTEHNTAPNSAPTSVDPVQPPAFTRIAAAGAGVLSSLPTGLLRLLGSHTNRDGDKLDADVRATLMALKIVSSDDLTDLPVADGRVMLDEEAYMACPKSSVYQVGSVTEHEVAGVRVRHYRPKGAESVEVDLPTVVYFHGGGWVLGSLDSHDSTCRWLCARGDVAVLSVDYRLAPEHAFPAGLDDATAVTVAVLNGEVAGTDPARVVTAGDSAGGNLTAAVNLRLRDEGKPLPCLQMLFVPVTDLRTFETGSYQEFAKGPYLTAKHMEWYRERYVPNEDDRHSSYASPLAATDLSGLPPAYVAVAGFDVLRDEGEAYAHRLSEAGVDVTLRRHGGLTHPFVNSTGTWKNARTAMDEAVGALRLALRIS
ncbi:alpha/beta hydrolase fold domain-containing protein [Corynebacterium sp. 4HC-13]|uniref:alpha/beta hydrolase n=1 Tax=Corynebacterium anserum TaxID=2684406 RepID=UPI0016395971|nr:alpha/beta hydrolase [Corynebacterium anserum]MBC2681087.1 alpha/beta hydrolase fold domain-containing protein [Corynebacterium anserum]